MKPAADAATQAVFPAPQPTELTAPYWHALDEGRLVFQRCDGCAHAWLPPRTECPRCGSRAWQWTQASGAATLVSWVVYHHAYHDWFATRLPYTVAVVALAEGPRLVSNIVDATGPLRIDMPLRLAIQREAGTALARFTPA